MEQPFFDYEKAMQALLYVISEIKNAGQHKTYKALYFAEQKYMREYGNTMLGETFTKMDDGPAPSHIRNLIQMAADKYQGRWLGTQGKVYAKEHLRVDGAILHPLVKPDMDYLAETEKACLDEAIEHCRYMSFKDLREESHDAAWHAATLGRPMDVAQIAKAGGANEDAVAYLLDSIANNNYCSL
jgi:hypothetical protein